MNRHLNFLRRLTIQAACLVAVATILSAVSHSQVTTAKSGAAQAHTFAPGIEIGTKLPRIELKNQLGKTTSVQQLLKKSPVAIVLFRSADW